jgi:hypothetical protein
MFWIHFSGDTILEILNVVLKFPQLELHVALLILNTVTVAVAETLENPEHSMRPSHLPGFKKKQPKFEQQKEIYQLLTTESLIFSILYLK